jgi:hypothetical protein
VNAANASTLSHTLSNERVRAVLFRLVATLRTDIALFDDVNELQWYGLKLGFDTLGHNSTRRSPGPHYWHVVGNPEGALDQSRGDQDRQSYPTVHSYSSGGGVPASRAGFAAAGRILRVLRAIPLTPWWAHAAHRYSLLLRRSGVNRRAYPVYQTLGTTGCPVLRKLTSPIKWLGWHYNGSDMAAGDVQRVWFPELIERLRSQWHQGMSFNAMVKLRDDLDAMLQQIRCGRNIRTPVFKVSAVWARWRRRAAPRQPSCHDPVAPAVRHRRRRTYKDD